MEVGRCRFLKEWPGWENSIHADPAQIERQGKSKNYPFTFELDADEQNARFSSTSDLPYYDTSLLKCSCYDFQERHLPCKHMYRLASELGIIEIFNRKPGWNEKNKELLSEVKGSEDIDAHSEQVKRAKKAMEPKMAPMSIDYEKQTAVFAGSGKKPYETTLASCTCRDFFVRRLPCKHIYRLRAELEAGGKS